MTTINEPSGYDIWLEMTALVTPWMHAAEIDTTLSPEALRKSFQLRDLQVMIMRAEESSVELEHVTKVLMSMMTVIHFLAVAVWGDDEKAERWSELVTTMAAQHLAEEQ
jgi:hypothetical protein